MTTKKVLELLIFLIIFLIPSASSAVWNETGCTGSPCDTYAAKNGSDSFSIPANFTITNAVYIDEGNTDVNYGTADNLTVFYNDSIHINKTVLLDLGEDALTNTGEVYLYQRNGVGSESLTVYTCEAFDETTETWATFYPNNTCTNFGTAIHTNGTGWITLAFQDMRYMLINTTTGQDNYIWESDDNVSYAPYVVFSEATEQNDCLSWPTACLNISRAESLIDAYGTVHIGYGNYTYQPAMNGALGIPVEYACDEAGYQENASEPWCDMPAVEAPDGGGGLFGSWPKYYYNYKNTGQSQFTSSTDGTLKWNVSVGSDAWYPIIDTNHNIYFGNTTGYYQKYDSNGTQLWAVQLNNESNNYLDSSGALDADTVYVPVVEHGEVFALNISDGSIKWNVTISPTTYYLNHITIGRNGYIYISDRWGYSEPLHALNPADGSEIWNVTIPNGINFASLAVDTDDTLYFGSSSGEVTAVDSTGGIVYQVAGNVYSQIAIVGDKLYYTDTNDLYCAWKANGTTIWTAYTSGTGGGGPYYVGNPSVDNVTGNIFIGDKQNWVKAINSTGSVIWTSPHVHSSAITLDADGNFYFADRYNDTLNVYSPSFSLLWQSATLDDLDEYTTPAFDSDGTIIVNAAWGTHLYAFAP